MKGHTRPLKPSALQLGDGEQVWQAPAPPSMSEVFAWSDIPRAHFKMWKNQHKPGNMAVLVQAKRPGMRTIEEASED